MSVPFVDTDTLTSRQLEHYVLDRLKRREQFRGNGVPEHDLPPVPADLLVAAEWNLLPGERRP